MCHAPRFLLAAAGRTLAHIALTSSFTPAPVTAEMHNIRFIPEKKSFYIRNSNSPMLPDVESFSKLCQLQVLINSSYFFV